MVFRAAPLSNGFMLTSMLGFIISAIFAASGRLSPTWGFTFCMMFVIMFISSFISMTHAPVEAELQIDMKRPEVKAHLAKKAKAGAKK